MSHHRTYRMGYSSRTVRQPHWPNSATHNGLVSLFEAPVTSNEDLHKSNEGVILLIQRKLEGMLSENVLETTVSDDTFCMRAFLLGPLVQDHHWASGRLFFFRVHGYIMSTANLNEVEPILIITAGDMLGDRHGVAPGQVSSVGQRQFRMHCSKISGGNVFRFYEKWVPVLCDASLSGQNGFYSANLVSPNSSNDTVSSADSVRRSPGHCLQRQNNAKVVAEFLERHAAIRALHQSTQSMGETSTTTNSAMGVPHYMSALAAFCASQFDRQKASLMSNAGREDAARATLTETQHELALREALLRVEDRWSVESLQRWHRLLCGGGLHTEAGQLRTKQVRVGSTNFRPHRHVASDFVSLCGSLEHLRQRLIGAPAIAAATLPPTSPSASLISSLRAWNAATYAAAVFFGVVDVHGFVDGNGRLARIALSRALVQAGLPFCIHLFATPLQRQEYTQAVRAVRRNLSLQTRGEHCGEDILSRSHELAGVLGPLVDLILDRVAKAATEMLKQVEEKVRLVTEEVEAKAAKAARDRERAGTCLICFDENPNIATLCCGKAVHLNCVAQWISSNSSCPNCRQDFPALSPRLQQQPQPPIFQEGAAFAIGDEIFVAVNSMAQGVGTESTEEDDEDDEHEHDGTTTALEEDDDDDDTTTMDEDDDEDEDTTIVQAAAAAIAAANDTTDMSETNTTDMASDDTTTTSDTGPRRPELPPVCFAQHCSNRSARDCINNACGRCCVMHGMYSCPRHGT